MDILTPEQFAAAKPGTIRNYALKRGGSVDVGTAAGKIIVTSKRELNEEQVKEAEVIVDAYTARQAKLAADKQQDAPQAGRAVTPSTN
jgi:hypothetical protein